MKVMTISDNPGLCTGLARIHRHAISALNKEGHEILPCIWNGYTGAQISDMADGGAAPELTYDGVRMMPVHRMDRKKTDMKDIFELCVAFRPDAILTIGDHVDFYYMHAMKGKFDYSFKWFAYLTTEVAVREDMRPLFAHADKVLVPSQHSKDCLRGVCDAEILPYGVEDVFKPAKKTGCERLRFITVASNTWRKDLPVVIQGVSLVQKECRSSGTGVTFYIHTNTYANEACDPYLYDLKSICNKLGVADLFTFPETNSVFAGATDEELATEYARSHFMILPSICESFAIPVVEAMACGLPAIANPCSAVAGHLADGRGIPLDTREEFFPPDQEVRRVTPEGIAKAIRTVLDVGMDKSAYKAMSEKCVEYANGFGWGRVESRICGLCSSISRQAEIPVEVL